MTAVLRADDGATIPLELQRWRAGPDEIELELLADLPDPVLDVGCGPGRVPATLARHGRVCLGIDPSAGAELEALAAGAPFLRRSVFAPLPGEGRWGTVVLLDGNIGIGGAPVELLRRCGSLTRPGGTVLAEVQPPGSRSAGLRVRVEAGRRSGPWFPWALVGADDWDDLAVDAGLATNGTRLLGDRWFGLAGRGS